MERSRLILWPPEHPLICLLLDEETAFLWAEEGDNDSDNEQP